MLHNNVDCRHSVTKFFLYIGTSVRRKVKGSSELLLLFMLFLGRAFVFSRQEDDFRVNFFKCNFDKNISFVLVMLYISKDAQNNKASLHYEKEHVILLLVLLGY